jgi:hypothetical protein
MENNNHNEDSHLNLDRRIHIAQHDDKKETLYHDVLMKKFGNKGIKGFFEIVEILFPNEKNKT